MTRGADQGTVHRGQVAQHPGEPAVRAAGLLQYAVVPATDTLSRPAGKPSPRRPRASPPRADGPAEQPAGRARAADLAGMVGASRGVAGARGCGASATSRAGLGRGDRRGRRAAPGVAGQATLLAGLPSVAVAADGPVAWLAPPGELRTPGCSPRCLCRSGGAARLAGAAGCAPARLGRRSWTRCASRAHGTGSRRTRRWCGTSSRRPTRRSRPWRTATWPRCARNSATSCCRWRSTPGSRRSAPADDGRLHDRRRGGHARGEADQAPPARVRRGVSLVGRRTCHATGMTSRRRSGRSGRRRPCRCVGRAGAGTPCLTGCRSGSPRSRSRRSCSAGHGTRAYP